VKTAVGSFGEESVSGDDGDDADLGTDGDAEDWDSSSLAETSTEGAVPKILSGFKLAMSIGLDLLGIGDSSRYDTVMTHVQVKVHLQCPHVRAHLH
jgi:hypothetical protein